MGLLENELQKAGYRTRQEVAMERYSVKTQATGVSGRLVTAVKPESASSQIEAQELS